MTLVDTISCGSQNRSTSTYILSRNRWNDHCLFKQPIEKLPTETRSPSVEVKRELIQVIIQMRRLHRSLVSTLQPFLDQSGNLTCQGQQIIPHISAVAHYGMLIAFRRQLHITFPSIATYYIYTAWLYTFLHCGDKATSRSISNTTKANSPKMFAFIFHCNRNQTFALSTTSSLTWFFCPPKESAKLKL